jgi:hypothetical protein
LLTTTPDIYTLSHMKKYIILLLLFLFAQATILSAQNYSWPLKITPELTSKFCDYRAGHFHSGLDIRTQGRIGLPVYAIDNGYVFRVATSFRGYGKALYLKLNDGRIVVYGHLSSFSDAVNSRVREEQIKDKKYDQDLYFTSSEFPVKKGEKVALSGSTGTGAPHLHFEMRSSQNNPINPLLSGFKLIDNNPPIFDYLSVRYYKYAFNPGDPCQMEYIQVIQGKDGFSLKDTITSNDILALGITGGDRVGGRGFLYGFFGLRLAVDDTVIFEMDSDSLSYNTTRQLNYVRDLEEIRAFSSKGKTDNDANIFYRLYIPPGATQYFWGNKADKSGILSPTGRPGSVRKITVLAYDESKNMSKFHFYVKEPELAIPQVKSYSRHLDTLIVNFSTSTKAALVEIQYRNKPSDIFKVIAGKSLSHRETEGATEVYGNTIRIIIPKGEREYRFCYLDEKKQASPWVYSYEGNLQKKFTFEGSPKYLKIDFAPGVFYDKLSIQIRDSSQASRLEMNPIGPNYYSCDIFDKSFAGPTMISISNGNIVVFDTTIELYPVYPQSTTNIYSPDSTLITTFQKGSAFYPSYVFSSSADTSSNSAGTGIVYDLQPDILLADTAIKFRINVSKLGLAGKKVGLYGYSFGGGWNFIGKIEGTRLEASGLGLGKIAIFEDTTSPMIGSISQVGTINSKTPLLYCIPRDNLSGLALDSGITMTLDDMWVPAEYDIDSGRFSYKVRSPLKAGIHKLEIKVSDNQGNLTAKIVTFTISGK